jgi:hypothetical protein
MSISFLDISILGLPTLEDETVALSRNVANQKPTEARSYCSGTDTLSTPQRKSKSSQTVGTEHQRSSGVSTVVKQPR